MSRRPADRGQAGELLGELGILLRLATQSPADIAYELGIRRRTVRRWLARLADDLDAAGYDGGSVRALAGRVQRPRRVLFSELSGRDRRECLRQFAPADLAPGRASLSSVIRSFRALTGDFRVVR